MKRTILFLTVAVLTLLSAQSVFAQRGEVTGKVTDATTGETVSFTTVRVDGTMTGTSAGADGTYSITVPSRAESVLVFSFLGYKTQLVPVNGRSVIDIVLEPDALALQETIVVAFGTSTREAFTGSATVVDSETISKRITTNVANALVGVTPGLQMKGASGAPGASQGSINIRGIASMYADKTPLVIVDGAPFSASLSNIPQSDVESITVLKDAASAALYGARGAAGVIIITTKTGQNKKAEVNVDMKWGASTRSIQDYETITDPGKYYETVYGEYYNYYYYGQGQSASLANANANSTMLTHLGYNVYSVPDGENLIGMNGKLNPNATLGRSYASGDETYYLLPDNWRDAAYRTAFRQEYNVSVNGAMDKGSYYASFGYLNEDGVIEYSGYERFTARLRADYQAFKWLKMGANVGYVNSVTNSNPNLSNSGTGSVNLSFYTTHIAPIYPIYVRVLDSNGNPVIRTDENGNPQYDYGVAASNYPGLTRPFLATGNPLGSNRYNKVSNKGQELTGTFNVDINFTKWLRLDVTTNINWGHTNHSDYETGLYGPKVSVNGQIDKNQSDNFRQNHVQTLTFYDQFGRHGVNIMAGHEWYDQKTTYLYAYAQGLFSPDIPEISAAANPVSSESYVREYNVEGWFASAQYNFDTKLFFSASYRRDASSHFAKSHRWGDFWSAGAAWLMNKEPWFNSGAVDELKLKASIGQQGNDSIGDWAYVDLYSLTASSETSMSASFYRIGNENITWETTTNLNIGAEFSFFSGRLMGELDYYRKKTTDLLFWLSVPESAGSRGYYGNIGDIRNAGIEFSLSGSVIRTKNVEWNINFNISHNNDKILKLPESKVTELGEFNENSMWYKVGGHLYNYFYADYAGVNDQGQALYWVDDELGLGVTNRPGKNHDSTTTNVNNATKYEQGNSLPDVFGGFGTTLYFYGVDISVTFDYQVGGQIRDYVYQSLMQNNGDSGDAGNALHVDVLKSWTPNNTSSTIPRFQYTDQYTAATSNRWLTSASYLNFQSFTVGYTFPEKWMKSLGLSKLRLYATGENLCFWSARKGLDPRYAYDSTSYNNAYSPVRTVMGGIQITF